MFDINDFLKKCPFNTLGQKNLKLFPNQTAFLTFPWRLVPGEDSTSSKTLG